MSTIAEMLKGNMDEFEDELKKRSEESRERQDEKSYSYGSIFMKDKIPEGVSIWRPDKGEHEIDILTFIAGKQHPQTREGKPSYCIDLWVYMNVGPTNEKFVAPTANFEDTENDPIALYLAQMRGKLSKQQFKRTAPKRRRIFLVWVHDTPEEEKKGVQILDSAYYYMGKPLDDASKLPKGGGHIMFAHPLKAKGKRVLFEINKTGKFEDDDGKEREGIEWTAPRLFDRDEDIPDYILEQVFPLDEVIHMYPTYDEIYKAAFPKGLKESTEQNKPMINDDPEYTPGECPHGHKFGVDTSQMDDCKKCKVWDDCYAKQSESIDEGPTQMTSVEDDPPDSEEPDLPEKDEPEEEPEEEEIKDEKKEEEKPKTEKKTRSGRGRRGRGRNTSGATRGRGTRTRKAK